MQLVVSMCRRNGKVVFFSHQHVTAKEEERERKNKNCNEIHHIVTRPSSICPRLDFSTATPKFFVLNILARLLFFRIYALQSANIRNFHFARKMKLTSLCRCRCCHRKILYYFSPKKILSLLHCF